MYLTFSFANHLQVIEQSGVVEAPGLCYRNTPAVVTTAVGQMVCAISSMLLPNFFSGLLVFTFDSCHLFCIIFHIFFFLETSPFPRGGREGRHKIL